jgi:hypothetical protein
MKTIDTNSETRQPSVSALRRKAARREYKLTKLRENSRWFNSYGPFMIVDPYTNSIILSSMTLQEAADWIATAPKVD